MFFFASLAFGQVADSVLTGSVVDSTGALVPGAAVNALNLKTGDSTSEVSNSSGVSIFPVLPPGDDRVSAEKAGFKKYLLDKLTLRTGDHVEQNLVLEIGTVNETVQVEANSEAVTYLTGTQGGLLSTSCIEDLPVAARNVMDFVLTQPGVNGTNFNGSRNDLLNITLDTANIQDNFITESLGTTQIFASVDRIEEVRVVTSPADNTATPTSVNLAPLPSGSVYKSGNNVLYFTGLTQVPDPSIQNMPANHRSQSSLLAIQGPNGQIRWRIRCPASLARSVPPVFADWAASR
jgi:hypothetical protein